MASKLTIKLTAEQKTQVEKFLGKKIKGTTTVVKREDLRVADKNIGASLNKLNSILGMPCCW